LKKKIFLFFRQGVSDMKAAALANALLKDLGLLKDQSSVIDAAKIQREKMRVCAQTIEELEPALKHLTAIGIDTKRDAKVPIMQEVTTKNITSTFRFTATVEHMTVTAESGPNKGKYLTHRAVDEGQGKGVGLAELTYNILVEYQSIDTIQAVLVDNTATNTGHTNGMVAILERRLGRKLHMIGCFLHLNELPLRHLIQRLDGKTTSGNKFTGPIGKLLDGDFYKAEPISFEPVESPLQPPPEDVIADLSTDQRLLLETVLGISRGNIHPRFVKKRPGPVCLSR
jgi:hypothetical protein